MPGNTKRSRSDLHQRGRARNAAHGMTLSRCGSAYQAPPLYFCWQSVVLVSGESGVPLSPGTTMSRLAGASWLTSQFGARQCSHATSKLHNAPLHKVPVQSFASSFCDPAPLRALRVYAAGVMQNYLRWNGRQSPALPGRFAPYVQSSVALVLCWRCGIYQALCALFWLAVTRG